MLKKLYELAKQLFVLIQESQQNKSEIKELRQELKELTAAVQRIAYEVHRLGENDAHEREKLALRLENELLKFERRLPSATSRPKTKEK
jgi:hypothetical protein